MSKFYAQWRRPRPKERRWRVHPIWRGIGCLMIVLVPLISFFIADLAVDANMEQNWINIPRDLLGPAGMPVDNLYAKLVVTAVVAVLLFAAYTVLYMFVYSLFGPSRYGPLDAKPVRRKARPRRRGAGRR